jgi:hypothetical protein
MLEKKKHGNGKSSGAGANCSDVIASRQNFRAARVAIAAEKIRHRDIVNLKQSVTRHAALQQAPFGADVTTSVRSRPRPRPTGRVRGAIVRSSRPASRSSIERGGCTNSAPNSQRTIRRRLRVHWQVLFPPVICWLCQANRFLGWKAVSAPITALTRHREFRPLVCSPPLGGAPRGVVDDRTIAR